MVKYTLFLLLFFKLSFAYSSNVINAYAVEIYDDTHKESIQSLKRTRFDYNGECYMRVYIFGKAIYNRPTLKIGTSIGKFVGSRNIIKYNKTVGKEITFKFGTVKSGYIKLSYNKKIYDMSLYVK